MMISTTDSTSHASDCIDNTITHARTTLPILIICMLSVFLISGCSNNAQPESPTLKRIAERGVLNIGHRETSIPFSYVVAGKPIGYSMDLCLNAAKNIEEAISKHYKTKSIQINYIPVTSVTRMSAIETGQIDLECGSTSDTLKRRETVDFSSPIYFSAVRLLVRTEHPALEIEDLRGMGVVTTKGTSAEKVIAKLNDDRRLEWQVFLAKDHQASFDQLLQPQVSALVLDDVLVMGLLAAYGHPERFRVLQEAINIEQYAIMLPRGDQQFKDLVNASLSQTISSGQAAQSYAHWFEKPIPPFNRTIGMPMSPEVRQLLTPTTISPAK